MDAVNRGPIPVRPDDTTADAERVQLALLHEASIGTRLRRAFGMSATVIGLARRGLARSRPHATQSELDVWFVELHYGADLARELRADLQRRRRDGG